jgi:hypothetical protein
MSDYANTAEAEVNIEVDDEPNKNPEQE